MGQPMGQPKTETNHERSVPTRSNRTLMAPDSKPYLVGVANGVLQLYDFRAHLLSTTLALCGAHVFALQQQ